MFRFKKISLSGILWRIFLCFMLVGLFAVAVYFYVRIYSDDYIYYDLNALPDKSVGVVLGTSPRSVYGGENIFYRYRMDAAVELYEAGKVEYLILSGDNSTFSYNEPIQMRKSLLERGIPDHVMTLDYAGFRTLDSIVRSKEVFGQRDIIVISQKFHNERAVFIGRSKGIDIVAYNAKSPSFDRAPRVFIREVFARVNMILDLFVLDKSPRYLGDPVDIRKEMESILENEDADFENLRDENFEIMGEVDFASFEVK